MNESTQVHYIVVTVRILFIVYKQVPDPMTLQVVQTQKAELQSQNVALRNELNEFYSSGPRRP